MALPYWKLHIGTGETRQNPRGYAGSGEQAKTLCGKWVITMNTINVGSAKLDATITDCDECRKALNKRKDARESGEQVLKNGARRDAVQCPSCQCYFENAGDEVCPDSDCSLGEHSWKRTICNFYQKI